MSNNSPQIKTQLVVFFEVNFKLVKMRHVLSNIFDFVQFALDTNEFWFNVGFLLSHDSGLVPGYVTTYKDFRKRTRHCFLRSSDCEQKMCGSLERTFSLSRCHVLISNFKFVHFDLLSELAKRTPKKFETQ